MRYGLVDEYKGYLINSFQTIGWPDPFPDDCKCVKGSVQDGFNLNMPTDVMDLVYEESRYNEKYSPNFIYIPKKEVMLKIMRACVGVRKYNDFWLAKDKAIMQRRSMSFYDNNIEEYLKGKIHSALVDAMLK